MLSRRILRLDLGQIGPDPLGGKGSRCRRTVSYTGTQKAGRAPQGRTGNSSLLLQCFWLVQKIEIGPAGPQNRAPDPVDLRRPET
jgi:hypothetical protein